MNISAIIGMSGLIDDSSLIKWEFMSGEIMEAIPLYKEGSTTGTNQKKVFNKAKNFLDSALQGMTLKNNHNGALSQDYLMSSRTFEISLRVLLSSTGSFGIDQNWDSISRKLHTYNKVVSNILKNKKVVTEKQKENIDEAWMFFKTLADISRKKRTASIFSHEN